MYDPPKSNLEKYDRKVNACPKCGYMTTLWDYVKPFSGMPNAIRCKSCGSLLRYSLGRLETYLFGFLGFIVAGVPAYFLWPPVSLLEFAKWYIPMLLAVLILASLMEGFYVRKYHRVELVNER